MRSTADIVALRRIRRVSLRGRMRAWDVEVNAIGYSATPHVTHRATACRLAARKARRPERG